MRGGINSERSLKIQKTTRTNNNNNNNINNNVVNNIQKVKLSCDTLVQTEYGENMGVVSDMNQSKSSAFFA